MSPSIMLSIGKVTIRDAGGAILGTVAALGPAQYEYTMRRIRGYAASHAEAVDMLRKLREILPRTTKEQARGQTRTRAQGATGNRARTG